MPLRAKVFTDEARDRTLVYVTTGYQERAKLEKLGIQVIVVPSVRGHVSLKAVLRDLARRDCMHVVCEGGGVMAQALLGEKLIDQCWMFYSPRFLGDAATPSVAGRGWKLDHAPGFVMSHVEQLGKDVLLVMKRPPTS